jgi:ATP-dependent DNA helicase RecG
VNQLTELQNIIAQGEGYFTEFKRNINSDLKKELVAFANASGGNIFLGIEDDGTVCGINITNQLISQIHEAASECDPPINIEIINHSNQVLQIHVFESNTKPHRTTTGFYLRVGANSQKMRTDTILEFLEKEGRVRFDERIRSDVSFETYFSENQWQRFLRLSGISPAAEKMAVLQSLGSVVFKNSLPFFTNAGLLIFTENPSLFIHQAYITCVAFRTKEKVDIADRKDFHDDFFSNIENTLAFIERHINVGAKITDTIREDIWEIPKVALRESIVNAVVHRDYLETGARVMIEIYPDKIIISNPGGLPKGMPEADFGKYSLARNATLANLMQRARFIEKLGTGITRIRQEAEKAGIHDVEFSFGYFFAVEFKRISDAEKGSLIGSLESSLKTIYKGLNDSQLALLNCISENPGIRTIMISNLLSRPVNTLEKQIKVLISKELIERRGGKKTGGYFVMKNAYTDIEETKVKD